MGSLFSLCSTGMRIKEETKKVPPPRTAAPKRTSVRQREAGSKWGKRRERETEEKGWQAEGEQAGRQRGRVKKGSPQTAVPGTLTACCQSSSSEAVTGLWMPLD